MTQMSAEQQMEITKQLAAKLQAFQDGLTEDERQVLGLAIRRIADSTDTQGYRAAQYEEEDGWKGPPGTNPHGAKGGNAAGFRTADVLTTLGVVAGSILLGGSTYNHYQEQ